MLLVCDHVSRCVMSGVVCRRLSSRSLRSVLAAWWLWGRLLSRCVMSGVVCRRLSSRSLRSVLAAWWPWGRLLSRCVMSGVVCRRLSSRSLRSVLAAWWPWGRLLARWWRRLERNHCTNSRNSSILRPSGNVSQHSVYIAKNCWTKLYRMYVFVDL